MSAATETLSDTTDDELFENVVDVPLETIKTEGDDNSSLSSDKTSRAGIKGCTDSIVSTENKTGNYNGNMMEINGIMMESYINYRF